VWRCGHLELVTTRSSAGIRVLSTEQQVESDRTLTGDAERGVPRPQGGPGSGVTTPRYEDDVEGEAPTARRLIDAERRVHRILRARFAEALLELAVSFAQLEVMELLHDVERLHPGEIGRRLLITRQSAGHLVKQLERGTLVETWPLDGGMLGVRLIREGRRRMRLCYEALQPTFECMEALGADAQTRLATDLAAAEALLRPRPKPWWLEPF
jgi:DNA-binding MarR family transcriptional regulator